MDTDVGGWLGPLTLAGLVFGFIHGGGVVGSITGGLTVYLTLCGLAIVAGEEWAGPFPGPSGGLAVKIGGCVGAGAAVLFAVSLGWTWGWAGAIGGYATGAVVSVIGGALGA